MIRPTNRGTYGYGHNRMPRASAYALLALAITAIAGAFVYDRRGPLGVRRVAVQHSHHERTQKRTCFYNNMP